MNILLLLIIINLNGDYTARADSFLSLAEYNPAAIDSAVYYYREASENDTSAIRALVDALDYKFTVLLKDSNTASAIMDQIEEMERRYSDKKPLPVLYFLIVMWGRYGEQTGIMDAVRHNVPNTIRQYALELYQKRKSYGDWAAALTLGRLHYMTPRIPLFLTWPSLEKSQMFLEEFVNNAEDTSLGMQYLRETREKLKGKRRTG